MDIRSRCTNYNWLELKSKLNLDAWKVKDNIVWLKDCPLPENEVFMRY